MSEPVKAMVGDVPEVHHLLEGEAAGERILSRSLSELYDTLRDFFIARNSAGDLIGVGAIHVCWEELAEIRSLVVKEPYRRRGIGRALVNACLAEAPKLGIKRVFVLTYETGFFRKFGFSEVEKSVLPHKIWSDCLKCVKFPDCDETAMILEL